MGDRPEGDPAFPDAAVRIGAGILAGAGPALSSLAPGGPVFVVTDANVAPHWLDLVTGSLRAAGFAPRAHVVPAGEETKSLAVAESLYRDLAASEVDRAAPIVALGGGVVTDLAGFVAATWLRGVPWIALPTSLLAQVDAAVGGKTGVNLPEGKNLVGAFWPAKAVVADVETLDTLPPREFRSGLAEAAKIALTLRPDLLAAMETAPERFTGPGDRAAMAQMVSACVAAKLDVVGEDMYEAGRRRVLNFGHTVGHAIEAAAGYGAVRHGEAVAVGMAAAARVSARRGLLGAAEEERVRALLRALRLPVDLADLPAPVAKDRVAAFFTADKKRTRGRLVLVLLHSPGHAILAEDGSPAELLSAL